MSMRASKRKMIEALSRFIIADDVEMEDLSEQQVTFALQGPFASQVLAAAGVSHFLVRHFNTRRRRLAGTTVQGYSCE